MKAEILNNMMHNTRSHFPVVEKLPRLHSDFTGAVTEETDVDDYYPYVIGHGTSFKVIDPKVYKQLRRHNIQRKKPVQVEDCARKPATLNNRTASSKMYSTDDADEYCELSPLAKGPSTPFSSIRLQSLDPKSHTNFGKISSFERRLYSNCYYSATKTCVVESTPSSPTTLPTTKLVHNTSRSESGSQWTSEKQEPLLCGVEADEFIDYASCMCCVKGIFYHCTKDSQDEGQIVDKPCSCAGPVSTCVPRWGLLAVLSVFIPCLWCYVPAMGCKKAAARTKKKTPEKRYKIKPKSSKR